MNVPVRFGQWLQVKRNACLYGAVVLGVPTWVLEAWVTWNFSHTFGWLMFLGVVALLAGVIWGWAMWHFMARGRERRQATGIRAE